MGIYGIRDGKFTAKKISVADKVPVNYNIVQTVATSTTAMVSAWDTSAGTAAKLDKHFTAQPPYAMELSVSPHVAGTASHGDGLIFAGYDAKGNYVKETVAVAGTADSVTYTNNAFAKVVSVTPDAADHKSTDVNIGWRGVIGLPHPIASSADILSYSVNAIAGTASDLPTIDTTYDSFAPATMTAGSAISITYLTKFQK